ncbi:alpha-N-acetylgalactosaminidase [Octopus bimaculoides]|uniref:Alpha-galactosidase n=1 Tax=Octopus bimaculoides TaxID=37653 RepID=A0A0L8H4W2_OCTBM|nr:alpha-N-acetylgalactosaminidase [Octopus bimaculoides]XP_014775433.1 alpha-N-acetylgalactosaminidase [Octopus bimaculoides]|eukprot:XP_014775432.1 PREDICTED: alpha-N-acetylgalactosaminidase-like [Octopus bimaculoides]
MVYLKIAFGLASILLLCQSVLSLKNGLALTPPMGWLSWERFRCNIDCDNDPDNCISEKLFMQMADHVAADGFRDVGYEYINIDDCWLAKERDAKGRLQADPKRFPNGIKKLAQYIHSKGLKLGIYEDFGRKTCGGFPGSEFFLNIDAETFAEWEVDFLKLDGCYANTNDMPFGYPLMEFFLNLTGRPILYSCSWPAYVSKPDYNAIAKSCNIWRNYHDIEDSWASIASIIKHYGDNNEKFAEVAKPGQFNDPDMLIIGDFGLSEGQQKVQMGMWAIMASPLIMSVDLRTIKPFAKELLTNKRVIAVNQDPLGIQGKRIWSVNNVDYWMKPILPHGSYAIAFVNFNTNGVPKKINLSLKYLNLTESAGYKLTEVFDGKFLGIYGPSSNFTASVDPTGIYMVTAIPLAKTTPV